MRNEILVSYFMMALPVVVRIAAMVMTMPVVAGKIVPPRVKAALVISLSVLIIPAVIMNTEPSQTAIPAISYAFGLVNEALIGALLGMSLSVILAAAQLAGSLIEGLSGLSMAAFGAPADGDAGNSPLAKLFWWTTIAVFVAAGGLGQVVDGMLGSFTAMPVGTVIFDQSFVDFLVSSIGYAFEFGMSAALPAIAALLVASLVLGMAQRNFPQLGGMQVGLSIKSIFGMTVTSVVLLSAPWIVNGGFELTMNQLQTFIQQFSAGQTG